MLIHNTRISNESLKSGQHISLKKNVPLIDSVFIYCVSVLSLHLESTDSMILMH